MKNNYVLSIIFFTFLCIIIFISEQSKKIDDLDERLSLMESVK